MSHQCPHLAIMSHAFFVNIKQKCNVKEGVGYGNMCCFDSLYVNHLFLEHWCPDVCEISFVGRPVLMYMDVLEDVNRIDAMTLQ